MCVQGLVKQLNGNGLKVMMDGGEEGKRRLVIRSLAPKNIVGETKKMCICLKRQQ